jgi:hypothetical protein
VNGSELAFAGDVVAVGVVLLVVAGEVVLDDVVGVFVDLDGDVPLVGFGTLGSGLA